MTRLDWLLVFLFIAAGTLSIHFFRISGRLGELQFAHRLIGWCLLVVSILSILALVVDLVPS